MSYSDIEMERQWIQRGTEWRVKRADGWMVIHWEERRHVACVNSSWRDGQEETLNERSGDLGKETWGGEWERVERRRDGLSASPASRRGEKLPWLLQQSELRPVSETAMQKRRCVRYTMQPLFSRSSLWLALVATCPRSKGHNDLSENRTFQSDMILSSQ